MSLNWAELQGNICSLLLVSKMWVFFTSNSLFDQREVRGYRRFVYNTFKFFCTACICDHCLDVITSQYFRYGIVWLQGFSKNQESPFPLHSLPDPISVLSFQSFRKPSKTHSEKPRVIAHGYENVLALYRWSWKKSCEPLPLTCH